MNNFKYSELNAKIPVITLRVGVHMHVKCVVRHLVKRAVL
jgi:hypothetical protein